VGGLPRQVSVFMVGGYGLAVALRTWTKDPSWARALWTTPLIGVLSCLRVRALIPWDRVRGQAASSMAHDQHLTAPSYGPPKFSRGSA
jgi:hypothetical protein